MSTTPDTNPGGAPKRRGIKLRTYDEALRRLSELQSNKTIVNLFSSNDDPNNLSPSPPKAKDLNDLAIPEVLAWLSRAGYTPSSLASSGLRCVHVSGTKGKGSVSTLISSILTQYATSSESPAEVVDKLGPVVGLYTSPHVLTVRERIQLNGEPISQEKFALYFFEVWDRLSEAARQRGDLLPSSGLIQNSTPSSSSSPKPSLTKGEEEDLEEDEYDSPATKPFYFRFLTLLAFHTFIREGVKTAVIECGIGGEYDPTNILSPEGVTASVVTQLGIDHISMLGDSLPKIAWHKSGIFKPSVRGLTRLLPGEEGRAVMNVLRTRASEKGASGLVEVADEEVQKWWDSLEGKEIEQEAKLQGPFQRYNMALAVKAAREHLLCLGVPLFPSSPDGSGFLSEGKLQSLPREFLAGLTRASLPGRCQIVTDREENNLEWYLDGAHTEDSLEGVGSWFVSKLDFNHHQHTDGEKGERTEGNEMRILLFNQQDRDPGPLIKALLSGVGYSSSRSGAANLDGDKNHNQKRVFTQAIFTRNEEFPPTADRGEPERDTSVQQKGRQTFLELTADPNLEGIDARKETETMIEQCVVDAVKAVRGLASWERNHGTGQGTEETEGTERRSCKVKVLVTGSFHLVGAVLKRIVEDVKY